MLISRRGYNWKSVLSSNWWAYNIIIIIIIGWAYKREGL